MLWTANVAMDLYIHSPDTDVSCASKTLSGAVKTFFVFTTGDNRRAIGLSSIASALGSVKLAALHPFHADITGRFSVRGKLLCWKTFVKAEDTLTAFGIFGATVHPLRLDIGPFGEVDKPALSAWSRYLTSQETKMAYIYVQKKVRRIG